MVWIFAIFLFGATARAEQLYTLRLPLGLQAEALYLPDDNPLSADKIALGQQLFFDTRLSLDNTISCATCHDPALGFADGQPVSIGFDGKRGKRSTPSIVNRAFSKEQFWDGRGADLEDQAKSPIINPGEMGFTYEGAVERLMAITGYRTQFTAVYGTSAITIDQIAQSIAAFERTLLSGNSAFDRYAAGDTTALSASAQRGHALFRGKADCFRCHVGFNFTDESYRNIGVGLDQPDPDLGRFSISGKDKDRGAFKTPTLRDISLTAPYFHDGSAKTLLAVVEWYDQGGLQNPQLAPEIKELKLTAQEKADLVEFMHALTGDQILADVAPDLPQ